MESFFNFITNPLLLSCIVSMTTSQVIKAFVAWRNNHNFHWRYLFISAGMPSSHTATVVALSLGTYLTQGPSVLLMIVLVLSSIVIRDVIGDKHFAQQQEDMVNAALHKISENKFEEVDWDMLIGHTFREVFAGAALAVAITSSLFLVFA